MQSKQSTTVITGVLYDDLFMCAEAAKKPDKENAHNASYRFPKYLGNKPIEIRLDKKASVINFIENGLDTTHRFRIDPEMIAVDGRTTCMIKNIPNKFTSAMLVDFVNETHFGQFDFIYLRMDFKNKCNVGYAFVNFTSTDAVSLFYLRINGQKWRNFTSVKIAELSYASVQGFDSLVRKFRHRNTLLENKEYRPRIFHADGPLRGYEREFR